MYFIYTFFMKNHSKSVIVIDNLESRLLLQAQHKFRQKIFLNCIT